MKTLESLLDIAQGLQEPEKAEGRIAKIRETYAGLSAVYQAGEKKMVLK